MYVATTQYIIVGNIILTVWHYYNVIGIVNISPNLLKLCMAHIYVCIFIHLHMLLHYVLCDDITVRMLLALFNLNPVMLELSKR